MAKRSPDGGPHEASNGGMGIGPVDVLSRLSQPSQESVPARATVLPTKATSAAQVEGSRSSVKEDARTVGSRVIKASTRSVYVNGGSGVLSPSYSPNVREVRVWHLLRNPLHEQTNRPQAALKNTIADAPTTTTTKTSIKMAGSSTTRSALPVVVACISRMPTVAR